MESSDKQMSQKDYLKKYLSKDKGEKKKKKIKISSSSHLKRSVIIDDDLGLPNIASIDDEEFNLDYLGDEAPQIAGIVDERPLEVRAKETHSSDRWKTIDGPGEEKTVVNSILERLCQNKDFSKKPELNGKNRPSDRTKSDLLKKEFSKGSHKQKNDSDHSPHRIKKIKSKEDTDSDLSPPRTKKVKIRKGSDSDLSPPRTKKVKNKKDSDSDLSPPRTKKIKSKYNSDSDLSPPRTKKLKNKKGSDSDLSPPRTKKVKSKYNSDSDLSPPRTKKVKNKYNSDSDLSPPRTKKVKNKYNSDSDLSPPRIRKEKRRGGSDPDISHLKKSRHKHDGNGSDQPSRDKAKDVMRKHRDSSDSDLSPPRRTEKYHKISRKGDNEHRTAKVKANKDTSDSDVSPPRNKRKVDVRRTHHYSENSDLSPPKRRDEFGGTKVKHKSRDPCLSNERTKSKYLKGNSDGDTSPPRMQKKEASRRQKDYLSPEREYRKVGDYHMRDNEKRQDPNRRISPNRSDRKKKASSDSDLSPPRRSTGNDGFRNDSKNKQGYGKHSNSFAINEKKKRKQQSSDSDLSPPRKGNTNKAAGANSKKMDKTLDGKKAGLQDAKNLKEELKKLKEAEDVAFSKLQASVSGKNATTVMRDRKTGKIRDLEKEKREIIEKSAKQLEREKKYEKWGKGLKQVEDAEERLAEVLHEMNKPLARYAGDNDLEDMLKAREREGDPMLDYIRSKQAESISLDNSGKPKYQGHFMPNRFGIRPGHRWDGVDRSNGYEKSWFERQNARKAIQEEAYKWSTSDM